MKLLLDFVLIWIVLWAWQGVRPNFSDLVNVYDRFRWVKKKDDDKK